jgi:hypothetical protein
MSMKHFTKNIVRVWSLAATLGVAPLSYPLAQTTTTTHNRVIERQARTQQTGASLDQSHQSTITSIAYTDGMGRPVQSIQYRQSPNGNDQVGSAPGYDNLGRPDKQYLPYGSNGTTGGLRPNLPGEVNGFYNDLYAFGRTVYNAAGRPLTSYVAGQAWQNPSINKFKTEQVQVITTATIRRWVGESWVQELDGSQFYPGGTIVMKTLTDEDGRQTREYTNLEGLTVLQETSNGGTWLATAYAYDELDRLVAVLPAKLLATGLTSVNVEAQAELLYAFRYDNQGRQVMALTPGGGWTETVYNRLGQPVMSANTRIVADSKRNWMFTKSDGHGRPVLAGNIYSHQSRAYWQNLADQATDEQFETRGGSLMAYTNRAFPVVTEADLRLVNYYDDYTWPGAPAFTGPGSYQANVKGLPTGSKERTISVSNAQPSYDPNWLTSVVYYDDRGREIQGSDTPLTGASIRSFNQYDFAGQLTETRQEYSYPASAAGPAGSFSVRERYDYDHAGRKIRYYHLLGTNPANERVLAEYDYDELGRLVRKRIQPRGGLPPQGGAGQAIITRNTPQTVASQVDVASQAVILQPGFAVTSGRTYHAYIDANSGGSGDTTNALQKVNYTYDLHSRLRTINHGVLNPAENDLFALTLTRHEDARFFAGNLSKMRWRSYSRPNADRGYTYTYDAANRLAQADYTAPGGLPGEDYSLTGLSYDPNGNLITLNRRGMTAGTPANPTAFGPIDQLTYQYGATGNGNRLYDVSDAIPPTVGRTGFKDQCPTCPYQYWPDGSLRYDQKRQLLIHYNEQDQPADQVSNQARYINRNRFSGPLVSKTYQSFNPVQELVTYYLGRLTLAAPGGGHFLATDEGRVLLAAPGGNLDLAQAKYQYFYHDQQGSLRVIYGQAAPSQMRLASFEPGEAYYNRPDLTPGPSPVGGQLAPLPGGQAPGMGPQELRTLAGGAKEGDLSPSPALRGQGWGLAEIPGAAAHRSTQAAMSGQHAALVTNGDGPADTFTVGPGERVRASVYVHVPPPAKPKRRWWLAPFAWASGRLGRQDNGEAQAGQPDQNLAAGAGLAVGRAENAVVRIPTDNSHPQLYIQVLDSAGQVLHTLTALAGPNAQGGWEPLALDYTADSTVTLRVGVANPGATLPTLTCWAWSRSHRSSSRRTITTPGAWNWWASPARAPRPTTSCGRARSASTARAWSLMILTRGRMTPNWAGGTPPTPPTSLPAPT